MKRVPNQTDELIRAIREGLGSVGHGIHGISKVPASRVTSLTEGVLASGEVIEAVGIPVYVDDVTQITDFTLTETGWYVFARITAETGTEVTSDTTVTGAAASIVTPGENYVDVAVRFEVAAQSQSVTVAWGTYTETFVFKATDLAVRNLDYRTTFYVYDLAPYITWEFGLSTDDTHKAAQAYFHKVNDEYVKIEGVTDGSPIPKWYTASEDYVLTTDTTFAEGKTYYTKSTETYVVDVDVYTPAEVTVGEAVTANTYYEFTTIYTQCNGDQTFEAGVTYYTKSGDTYTVAEVTVGEVIPAVYQHSKIIISGPVRNVTYRLDDTVDCPMEFILPEIETETHGCWFEMRFRHAGEYSMTLTPPSEDVKIATEHTQRETAGINMVDLHYTAIDGVKLWRFMNTHSSIPAAAVSES